MEKVSFILPKLAIIALLIGTIVPMFGEGQMVIEEVTVEESKPMNVVSTYGCQTIHQECIPSMLLECCRDLYCDIPPYSPRGAPGICKAECAEIGRTCGREIGIPCCEGLTCYYPPEPFVTEGICKAECAEIGRTCGAEIGIPCCAGLTCYYPRVTEEGICVGL